MWVAFLLVSVALLIVYKFFLTTAKKPNWWGKHGVKEIEATHIASQLEILLGKKNITLRDDYGYNEIGSGKFWGTIESPCPVVMLKDLDVIKKIFIKDFDHFVDRRDFFTVANKDQPMAKMLGLLKGDEWKGVRASVSPVFTTGKIRRMMEHFNSVGKEWVDMIKTKAGKEPNGSLDLEIMNTANQFTLEVIANSVFGIKAGAISDPDCMFVKMALRLIDFTPLQQVKLNLSPRYPELFKLFGIEAFDMTAMNFFEQIVRQGMQERMKSGVKRNDFQEMLLETRAGELKGVGSDELSTFEKDALLKELTGKAQYLTDEMIVAQSILFFIAGFMGTSSFITFATYVLAVHQDIQEKLRNEVDEIVQDDGTIDYDDLGKLTYLDMVVNEILRKYPVATRLERIALKDYHDPESGLYLPKDTVVGIPVNSIHHDPHYYSNPDKFDPEHFNNENKGKRSPYAYMPFGHGPRNCIGMRFALVESKAALAHLIHNFRIDPTAATPVPIEFNRVALTILPPRNLQLRLTPV